MLLFCCRTDLKHGWLQRDSSRSCPTALCPSPSSCSATSCAPTPKRRWSASPQGGIKLKILSGDNPDTVQALAEQAGFHPDTPLMSGIEFDKLPESEHARVVEEVTIFGRISPRHKEQILAALQANGHYVAMIGDGVNDVPALKAAEVGIAMRSGSPVTRSVADIVLLNDSFSALPAAFIEGQRIRLGMQEIVRLFLVRSLSVALVILGAACLGETFPVTPRHTALISMLAVGGPRSSSLRPRNPARASTSSYAARSTSSCRRRSRSRWLASPSMRSSTGWTSR